MSTLTKIEKEAQNASKTQRQGVTATSVSNIIKSIVDSELVPTKEKYILRDERKEAQCYRANFSFQGNLRYYLNLQNQISREKNKLSALISFTSSRVGPDALAVPASTYVTDTWGCDGTTILKMIDDSMASPSARRVSGTLTSGCEIWITVNRNDLHLTVMGGLKKCPRSSIIAVIEQICWLVSVAGNTPTRCLAKYAEEMKRGTPTRIYSETIYTGNPVIEAGDGICISVSFTEPAQPFRQANQALVRTSGHCWKTMIGVTIIANGFAIPTRPRQGSGLEAPLSVLRQLIKRGYHEMVPFALDRPMVAFAPRKVQKTNEAGQVSTSYTLRYILAAEFEQPLRKRGNVIYWHFDPAKVCNSDQSLEQVEAGIDVEPEAIDPDSRHFVGWTRSAGHLAASRKKIPLGSHSFCKPCPHYQLVVSALSATFRIPGPVTLGVTISAEKNDIEIADIMLADRQQKLHHVSSRLFVLWDKHRQRGWLVGGDTVALLLLRVYAQKNEDPKLKEFDFGSLENLGDGALSAYKVLAELNAQAHKEDIEKAEAEKAKKAKTKTAKVKEEVKQGDEEEQKKESIGAYLDELYALLLDLSKKTPVLNKTHALSTALQTWYHRKRATTITGADFDELTGSIGPPKIYNYRMKKDPGWLRWAKAESVTFMLASGLGEILEPKDGSCCSLFPTLPSGENFLAAELRILKRFIMRYAGDASCFPPDQTVARLSREHGWERRSDPFPRQKCHGDDPSTIGPSCFPVQGTLSAPLLNDTGEIVKKNRELLRDKPLYTVKEITDMIDNNPSGIVVFGRQPKPKELEEISRRSRQRSQSDQQQTLTAKVAQSSGRPSSHGSASGSTTSRPLPVPGTGRALTDDSASTSTQRTPSMTSMRSAGSGTLPRPGQGNSSGAEQRQASASRSPAASMRKAASNMSLRKIVSNTRHKTSQGDGIGAERAQPSASQSPASSIHKAASQGSLRSNGSSLHPTTSQRSTTANVTGSGQPELSASRSPVASVRQAASNASLRSTSSTTRSIEATGGAGRSQEPIPASNARTAARQPSNASIRTTSSVASRATTGSQTQRPPAQTSDMGLKKTATNSSERTTGLQSSRVAQNLEAFNSNRQQQPQLVPAQLPVTSSNQGTNSREIMENPASGSTSTDPAHVAAGGRKASP